MSGIGDQFQYETQYEPDRMPRHQLIWETKPDLYKEYREAAKIELQSFEPFADSYYLHGKVMVIP